MQIEKVTIGSQLKNLWWVYYQDINEIRRIMKWIILYQIFKYMTQVFTYIYSYGSYTVLWMLVYQMSRADIDVRTVVRSDVTPRNADLNVSSSKLTATLHMGLILIS